jgi:hypothetical protein
MFVQNVIAGAVNTTLTYSGEIFISFTSIPPGTLFYVNGVDITAGVSLIDNGSFVNTQTIQCDESTLIVDDSFNVYFKVVLFTNQTTALPTR